MTKTRSERGSVTIEALLSTPTLIVMFVGFVSCSFVGFAKVWIRNAAYEATICLASQAKKQFCEKQLRLKTERVLPGGSALRVFLSKSPSLARADVELELFSGWKMKEKQTLPLPLRSTPFSRPFWKIR